MNKFILASCSVLALSGCATFNAYKAKAITVLCENKETLVAIALANNDMATVHAIDAYCSPSAPVSGATVGAF